MANVHRDCCNGLANECHCETILTRNQQLLPDPNGEHKETQQTMKLIEELRTGNALLRDQLQESQQKLETIQGKYKEAKVKNKQAIEEVKRLLTELEEVEIERNSAQQELKQVLSATESKTAEPVHKVVDTNNSDKKAKLIQEIGRDVVKRVASLRHGLRELRDSFGILMGKEAKWLSSQIHLAVSRCVAANDKCEVNNVRDRRCAEEGETHSKGADDSSACQSLGKDATSSCGDKREKETEAELDLNSFEFQREYEFELRTGESFRGRVLTKNKKKNTLCVALFSTREAEFSVSDIEEFRQLGQTLNEIPSLESTLPSVVHPMDTTSVVQPSVNEYFSEVFNRYGLAHMIPTFREMNISNLEEIAFPGAEQYFRHLPSCDVKKLQQLLQAETSLQCSKDIANVCFELSLPHVASVLELLQVGWTATLNSVGQQKFILDSVDSRTVAANIFEILHCLDDHDYPVEYFSSVPFRLDQPRVIIIVNSKEETVARLVLNQKLWEGLQNPCEARQRIPFPDRLNVIIKQSRDLSCVDSQLPVCIYQALIQLCGKTKNQLPKLAVRYVELVLSNINEQYGAVPPEIKEFLVEISNVRCWTVHEGLISQQSITARGVLLFGPPGTGKSTFARMIAQHAGFIIVEHGDLTDGAGPWVNENVNAMRRKFDRSKRLTHLPHVLVADEIDSSIGAGHNAHEETVKTSSKLRIYLDGRYPNLFLLTSTNSFNKIDDQFCRRLEYLVYVPPLYPRSARQFAMKALHKNGFEQARKDLQTSSANISCFTNVTHALFNKSFKKLSFNHQHDKAAISWASLHDELSRLIADSRLSYKDASLRIHIAGIEQQVLTPLHPERCKELLSTSAHFSNIMFVSLGNAPEIVRSKKVNNELRYVVAVFLQQGDEVSRRMTLPLHSLVSLVTCELSIEQVYCISHVDFDESGSSAALAATVSVIHSLASRGTVLVVVPLDAVGEFSVEISSENDAKRLSGNTKDVRFLTESFQQNERENVVSEEVRDRRSQEESRQTGRTNSRSDSLSTAAANSKTSGSESSTAAEASCSASVSASVGYSVLPSWCECYCVGDCQWFNWDKNV